MDITATDITTPNPVGLRIPRPSGDRFARELDSAESSIRDDGLDPETQKTLRTTAEQLVATTFIMPMLAKMREDPFKSDLFDGGQTEEIFGQRLDTILAERIVSKSDFSIVDAVYRSVAERATRPTGDEADQGVDTHG